MIAGLLGCQLTHRRKHSKCVAGQHDDVGWLAVDNARNLGIWDILDGIGATCVLSDTNIVVVWDPRLGVVDNVFEDTAKPNGIEDIWLLFRRQVSAFGVTTTFNIENTGVGPDMLIIANQKTIGIGRQGRFSSAGKTEEKSGVIFLHADIGGRMKRKLAELDGLQVVLQRETILRYSDGKDSSGLP